MRYRHLTLENFLVFKGEQHLTIPDKDGVVVVYGRNGKGKTSLLNAFRWVWSGEVRKRSTRPLPIEDITNSVALQEARGGSVRCRVRLEFEADGAEWDLTRSLTHEGGEYSQELILRKNSIALSAADAERQVAEIMPREIEQFFLFDGELLDQYEKLLDDDSTVGATLRDDIERILGLPILEHAAQDSARVGEDAGKEIAKAAQRDTKTKVLGDALITEQNRLATFRQNYEAEDGKAKGFEAESRKLEHQVAEQSGKLQIKALRDEARNNLLNAEGELSETREKFQSLLADSWRAVLVEPIAARLDQSQAELDSLEEKLDDLRFAATLARHYETSGGACPVCASHLDDRNRAALESHLNANKSGDLISAEDESVELKANLKRLRDSGRGHEVRADIRSVEDSYLKVQQQIEDYREDLDDYDDKLKGQDDDLNELVQRTKNVEIQLNRARDEYRKQRDLHEQAKQNIAKLDEKIRLLGGAGQADQGVYVRQQLAEDLSRLFEQAVVTYRDQLKENVQQKATELFVAMRSEQDFVKLTINESYGLRILDKRGEPVKHRSAGYEHLVALSLLGGLQASSPISGPLVMDSPFGRLDEHHVEDVVKNVDKLTSQVFLLVTERELPRSTARDLLRGRMLAEFELRRGDSAHQTNLQELHSV
ncbi:AAA family ATPase [Microbacterium betulae]|uniref:Nuclease SbcCD subunit C n=1 Tax=Microbacterium betulae TaxID=2981139 RepID=A0AA97FI52_9MICO|nr:AAA family ATPase [Microbacterium sp. AB]WOF23663.1 AAA family ATPase [Microbacterium sp. AB]